MTPNILAVKYAAITIKQCCKSMQKCNYCPLNDFCFKTWPISCPEDWDTDLIKEGE